MAFRESLAEVLPVADNSVHLVIAATAIHWFDMPKFHAEVDRVLVPNGVAAYFGYYTFKKIDDHPNSQAIVDIINEVKV